MEKVLIIAGFLGVMSFAFWGMYWLMKQADKFFKEANSIEEKIKAGEPKDVVLPLLYALAKKSFHRTTGERLTQLAKMSEVKYNVKILKS